MTHDLKDKIALITGASRGIGAAVAKRYAQEGAHVILVARTIGGLEEVDNEIKAAGGQSTLVPLDLKEYDKFVKKACMDGVDTPNKSHLKSIKSS